MAADSSGGGGLLAGKYRLDACIARGAMAEVYRGTNVSLDRAVAIKVLHQSAFGDAGTVERFMREAKAANAVSHPNILGVIDLDRDGESLFLVQDFLDGEDLKSHLKRRGRFEQLEALDVLVPVASALGAAHACSIVHRDIKPNNVFMAETDGKLVPKLLDFGIAKVLDDVRDITTTDSTLGTPAYMSPEQIKSPKLVDARSDVWSMGVLAHQLLSGRLPFRSETRGGMLVAICTDAPASLGDDVPGIDRELASIVARCLEKDPMRRFAEGGELCAALYAVRRRIKHALRGGTSLSPPTADADAPALGDRSSAAGAAGSNPWLVPPPGLPAAFASGPPAMGYRSAAPATSSPPFLGSVLDVPSTPVNASGRPAVVGIASAPPPHASPRPGAMPSRTPSRIPSVSGAPEPDEVSAGEALRALAVASAASLVLVWVGWSLRRPASLDLIGERWGVFPLLVAAGSLAVASWGVARHDRQSLAVLGVAAGLAFAAAGSLLAALGLAGLQTAQTMFRWLQKPLPWIAVATLGTFAWLGVRRARSELADKGAGDLRVAGAFGGAALLAVLAALRLLW